MPVQKNKTKEATQQKEKESWAAQDLISEAVTRKKPLDDDTMTELKKIIDHNDRNLGARISRDRATRWLRDRGHKIAPSTLDALCADRFNRRSFAASE